MSTISRRSIATFALAAVAAGFVFAPAGHVQAQQPALRIPAAFQPSLDKKVRHEDGTEMTLREAFARTSPTKPVKLHGGQTVTFQEYLDRLAKLHATSHRLNLHAVPKETMIPRNHAQVTAQQAQHHAEHLPLLAMAAKGGFDGAANPLKGFTMKPPPAFKPFASNIVWGDEWGNHDTVSGYYHFTVTGHSPAQGAGGCGSTFEAGSWVWGTNHSFVKLVEEYSGNATSLSGKTELYIMGRNTPAWSKQGSVNGPLSETWNTPPLGINYHFLGGVVGITGNVGASFTLGVHPDVGASKLASPAGVECKIGGTPYVKGTAHADAHVFLGGAAGDLRDHLDLIRVGVAGDATPIDIRIPIQESLKVHHQAPYVKQNLKVDVDINLGKGALYAYYDVTDTCLFANNPFKTNGCIGLALHDVADALGVPMHWRHYFVNTPGYHYAQNVVDSSF